MGPGHHHSSYEDTSTTLSNNMTAFFSLLALCSLLLASEHDNNKNTGCPFPEEFQNDPRFWHERYHFQNLCNDSKWDDYTVSVVLRSLLYNKERAAAKMILADRRFDPSLIFEAHPGNRSEALIKTLVKYYLDNHEEQRLISGLKSMFTLEKSREKPMSSKKVKEYEAMIPILFDYARCSHEMLSEMENIVVEFLTMIHPVPGLWGFPTCDYLMRKESEMWVIYTLLHQMMSHNILPVEQTNRKMSTQWYTFLTILIKSENTSALRFLLGEWALFTDRINLAKVPESSPSLLKVARSSKSRNSIVLLSMNRDIFLSIFNSPSKNRARFYIDYLPDVYMPLVNDETISAEKKYVNYIHKLRDGPFHHLDCSRLAELLYERTFEDF